MAPPSSARNEVLAWLLALGISAWALAVLGYQARDADSRLYAEIAAEMAARPWPEWIAPRFPPDWFMSGLFREHPVGIHLLPALLGRLGYPPLQAALAVNAVYVALSLALIPRLVAGLVPAAEARALGCLLQLIPIAFTFRVRANHEAAVLFFLLLALYGLERARERARWGFAVPFGLVGLLLVKGVLVSMGFGVCVLYLLLRPRDESERTARGWIALLAAVALVLGAAFAYDALYRQATGQPFWSFYLGRQLGVAAAQQSAAGVAQKLYNLVWYLGRVLWFPFPFSLALAAAVLRRLSGGVNADEKTRAGARFALAVTALYVLAFSLSDRRADRYIFPAYYAVGAAGAIAALRAWPWLRRAAALIDQGRAWAPAALWLVLFTLHILAGRLGVPTIKVWAPDT